MNPNVQHLSAGGSSGGKSPVIPNDQTPDMELLGEGALQALRGSAIGFGTDIGMVEHQFHRPLSC
jgi:hypothetical protein